MKYLGIDYGSKRIGLAVSDEAGRMAFPREVIANKGEQTLRYVAGFCEKNKIRAMVLGQSLDYKGRANPIQTSIENWKLKIQKLTDLSVHYQPEVLTSAQASRSTSPDKLDASAAALILQTWLDKHNQI